MPTFRSRVQFPSPAPILERWSQSYRTDIAVGDSFLIYIKNNSPDEGIVIEDKSNSEKNSSHEFKPNEIFKASDMMVDSLTRLIARTREREN